MFIGEMGSWLVIAGFWLYRYLILSRETPLLYRPVNTEETEENDDDDDTVRPTSRSASSPALKPLLPNADDRSPLTGWKVVLLGLPACCDIAGTTLMNVGLLFVAASIYQMTRGALVLFVGLFSVLFLKRKLYLYHWLSLVIVVLGVAMVGAVEVPPLVASDVGDVHAVRVPDLAVVLPVVPDHEVWPEHAAQRSVELGGPKDCVHALL